MSPFGTVRIGLAVHAPVPTAPLRELEFESRWASEPTPGWPPSCRVDLRFSQTGTLAASRRVLEKKTSDSIVDQRLGRATARQPQQVGWIHTNVGFFWTMSPPLFVCVCVCEREREICGESWTSCSCLPRTSRKTSLWWGWLNPELRI